ncbi:glycogen debranching protein GlgX [Pseudoalteromonas xiamenensis]|uniref:Glycogen debranching protein GlgX n=1 Tax=Pseudoalteromonas xiamenensis TaxID=882626 RepID=A0A975DJY0_9GAMM|nr:glycogen debranching protein GlgX [Pseudoalteromonas xiamenensis]QTH73110.1 glycogen debranching protein GlgX [Pseudoalteromonas xiamenensis]
MIKSVRGVPKPLGPTPWQDGVNFAVYAPRASSVLLCLFDQSGHSEVARIACVKHEGGFWSIRVSPLNEGALYGFRVDGPYEPEQGLFFNVNKLLLDPYATDLHGEFTWSERHFCHMPLGTLNITDNAIDMPKSRVRWLSKYEGERPNHPWAKTLIYETHVKGATNRNLAIPEGTRGKYLALCDEAFMDHIKQLGVTAIELLPCHAFISEQFLTTKGLQNYWGYNTLSFFVPHKAYLVGQDIAEFQQMVRKLHQNNIEVIVDVVFNHTAEAGIDGPMLSFKGFDNGVYYRTVEGKPDAYINDTGCGNTINIDHPATLRLVMDSLRYWVEVMGVDGFRFDLATILGRNLGGFNPHHAFLQAIAQDPILQKSKLIAEPWDVGPGGYQLGAFTAPWREWNDKFRDTVRRFWRGDNGILPELAKRIHGSNDVFEHNLRGPLNSINFITSHDGFTLADWVSYEQKHNEANGEQNRDGHSENFSFNCGVEGFSSDPNINALRLKMQKNALLTLLISKGVPMISAGSEFGHSQGGNNNAYCQDNISSWLAWKTAQKGHALSFFIHDVLKIRRQFSLFSNPFFVHPNHPRFGVNWYTESGELMNQENWHESNRKWLICALLDKKLNQAVLIVLNAGDSLLNLTLPSCPVDATWQFAISTSNSNITLPPQANLQIEAKSSWLFTAKNEELK